MSGFPPIAVRQPRPYDIVDDPVQACGVGTGFEGVFVARVRDGHGTQIAETSIYAGGLGAWGNYDVTLPVGVPSTGQGTLEVFQASLARGSPGLVDGERLAGESLVAERQIAFVFLDRMQPENGVQFIKHGTQLGEVHLVRWLVANVGQQLAEAPDLVGDLGMPAAHRRGGVVTAQSPVERGVEQVFLGCFMRGDLLGEQAVSLTGFGHRLAGRKKI